MGDVIEVLTTATNTVEVAATGPQGAPGVGVPTGGSALQVLRKVSSTDYDTEWAAAGSGSGSVTSVALAGTGLSISGSPITTSGTLTANVSYGTTAGTATQGNDTRIVNILKSGSSDDPYIGGNGGSINLAGGNGTTSEGGNGGHGGSINLSGGGAYSGVGANGGSINLSGGYDVGHGGSINLSSANNCGGGSIYSVGGNNTFGGSLNMSAGTGGNGGDINTNNGGGPIDTSNGGGSINTRGTGSIGLGVSGTRTTLTGTATQARAISLPNASGTIALNETFAAPPAIGNTTPAAISGTTGTFTTLTATPAANTTALTSTGYSLTGTNAQSLIDLSGTWNTTGVPIALKTDLTVTAAGSNSRYADFQVGGYSQFSVTRISSTSNALFLYNTNSGTNTNGVGANYERAFLRWSSNVLDFGNENVGTGGIRNLRVIAAGNIEIHAGNTLRWQFGSSSGALQGEPNLPIRFGGSSASFPRLINSGATLRCQLADGSAFATFECGALTLNGNLTASTRDIVTDTTTGTKIGTATTQKIGFFNATPVVQPAAVADATDAATVITQLNALLSRLRTLGLIAT